MSYQHGLAIGDIITIGKTKKEHLIVESARTISKAYDGDYWVDQIATIPLDKYSSERSERGGSLHYEQPKLSYWYFDDGCMRGKGREIKKSDVIVRARSEVKKQVITSYTAAKFVRY